LILMRTMIPSRSGDGFAKPLLKSYGNTGPGRTSQRLSVLVWSLKTTIELLVRSETRPFPLAESSRKLARLKRVSYHIINRWISSVSPNDRTVVDTDQCAECMNASLI
jgi:hypothetical protein